MNGAAPPGVTATVSPPAEQADRPPRLATAINTLDIDPDRSADGTDVLPAGTALTGAHLTAILEWIMALLDDDAGYLKAWESSGGTHPHPDQLDATGLAEESWARCMDELFLGVAYGGPSIIAGLKESHLFARFSKASDDPAYSLFVACQHMTTYGALGRGIDLAVDLAGYSMPASQHAANLPLFTTGQGTWYSTDASSPQRISSAEAFDPNAVGLVAGGFGPGTVYTYNPLGTAKTLPADVWVDNVFWDANGIPQVDASAGAKAILDAAQGAVQSNKETKAAEDLLNKISPLGVKVELPKEDILEGTLKRLSPLEATEAMKAEMGIITVNLATNVQVEGSHISMVLRRYKTTPAGPDSPPPTAVQMFDTTAHYQGGVNGSSASAPRDYAMFMPMPGFGIYAGEAYAASGSIPKGTGTFVGLGTLPPIAAAASEVEAHLRRVRPAGVARLVLVDVRANKTQPTIDDVLFISRGMLMWSNASPSRNYHVSRLLFSLRNTPYRKSIKAYWVVYAPRNALAASIWEEGARGKRLDEMSGVADKIYNAAMAAAIVGHDDAGLAQEIWRNRTGSSNGSPPRVLRSLFVDTFGPSQDWLKKKSDELSTKIRNETVRRNENRKKLLVEKRNLQPRVQAGDQAAIDRVAEIDREIDATLSAPLPDDLLGKENKPLNELIAMFVNDPLNDAFQPQPMRVRNNLLAMHQPSSLGGLTVPPALVGVEA